MRLDKFLSQQLGISRTQITRELRAKQVTVNGEKVKNGALQIEPEHQVVYNGQVISYRQGQRYFMLHKPSGYVCANKDPIHPTVFYFIAEPMREKLHSVGRLDKDTTGLVLLTDDGAWSHRITSPKHHCEKSYLVTLAQPLSPEVAVQLVQGIELKGEKNITKPAYMEYLTEKKVRLTLSEGRYHQVKRMFAALGNHVLELHRERIGNIVLDTKLPEGKYRPLTAAEIINVICN